MSLNEFAQFSLSRSCTFTTVQIIWRLRSYRVLHLPFSQVEFPRKTQELLPNEYWYVCIVLYLCNLNICLRYMIYQCLGIFCSSKSPLFDIFCLNKGTTKINMGWDYRQGGRDFFREKKRGAKSFFGRKKGGEDFFWEKKMGRVLFFEGKKGVWKFFSL